MKTNVGTVDRTNRIIAGLGMIGLAMVGAVGHWGYIGVLPVLTGLMRVCPAYSLLGVDTCPTGKG